MRKMEKLLKTLLKLEPWLSSRRKYPSPFLHLPTIFNPRHSSTSLQPLYQWRFSSPGRPFSPAALRPFSSTSSFQEIKRAGADSSQREVESDFEWEDEDETESQIGDGGNGGGIALQNVSWGNQVLSIAREVLSKWGEDVTLFAFKVSPRGYVYVRLDKLSNAYGCPGIEEIESFSRQYKKRLEEEGSKGEIPDDLALEVSSPGAERLLRLPDDLHRFRDFPMVVSYIENAETNPEEKTGVFYVDSVGTETQQCVWKLADVRENRDPLSKGRPLSRKRRDWRLALPYTLHKKVTLYLEC